VTRRQPALAKRLVEPTWLNHPAYVETYGPEVADVCALAGFPPDPTQELLLDLTFAIDNRARPVAFEVCEIGPRQNFKTGLIKQAELGWLYVTEEPLIVHSAHELDTTEESFNELRALIENTPALSRRLSPERGRDPGITAGNGRWAIELRPLPGMTRGPRMKFKARTKSGGRGLTGSKTVLDEAFAVTPSIIGSLYPTMVTNPMAQVLLASSAGMPISAYLRDLRKRGRVPGDPRLAYLEYGDKAPGTCASPDCDHLALVRGGRPGCRADDEAVWAELNSALTYGRIDIDTLRDMRRSMPAAEWLREFMVWWEDPPNDDAEDVIDLKAWARLANPKAKAPTRATVVLDVSPNRRKASIGVCGQGTSGKPLVMTYTAGGDSWVVPRLKRLLAKRSIVEVALHPGSQAAVLIPELMAAGIDFTPLTTGDVGQATVTFLRDTHAEEKKFEHLGQAEFDTAVGNAKTRFTSEGEIWDRKDPSIDITSLVAGSIAYQRWITRKPARVPMATFV